MKKKLQEIFHKFFIGFVPAVLFFILHLYRSTWRLTLLDENLRPFQLNRFQNFLYAHFHEDIPALSLKCRGDVNFCTMASQSRDGEIIARVLKKFGFEVCRGSSHRGGGTALLTMRKAFRAGKNLVLAVDGPKGPRRQVKSGIVALSQKEGAPIVIGIADAKYKFIFRKSWDQMWFPLPFSPMVAIFSEPIHLPDLPFEERRLHLERCMLELKQKVASYY